MKIQGIYKEEFIGKIMELNDDFYLFKKDIEEWNASDWKLWGEITIIFSRIICGKRNKRKKR